MDRQASAEGIHISVEESSSSSTGTCWVYLHMNKSGGTSIKAMLGTWVREHGEISKRYCGDGCWRSVSQRQMSLKQASEQKAVIVGGSSMALWPYRTQRCRWFTVFRHPVERVVSAYFYCKRLKKDQLCASGMLDAKNTDLLTFAKHWGNYGMRQFLMAFVPVEDVVNSGITVKSPEWYMLKQFEDRQVLPAESWMHQYLRRVEDILSNEYAAVGILKDFNTTLALFDATLDMPGMNWQQSFLAAGRRNSGKRDKEEEAAAVVQSKADPDMQDTLWLDILLYEHAVGVFNRQAKEHGLL